MTFLLDPYATDQSFLPAYWTPGRELGSARVLSRLRRQRRDMVDAARGFVYRPDLSAYVAAKLKHK
jgi:hypothetical protein